MKAVLTALVVLSLLLFGCAEQGEPAGMVLPPVPVDTLTISAADTIGTEMGDSPDVFAFILDACFTGDGSIVVLDAGRISVQVFDTSGQELFSLGMKGSGPGEFQMPMGLAVTDYGFVVSDIAGGKLVRFREDGTLLDEISGFFPLPPVRIRGAGRHFLTTDIFLDTSGETPSASLDFAAFADENEPVITFSSHEMDMNGGMINSDKAPEFAFAAGPGGEAYLAEMSDSLLLVTGYRPDGTVFITIEEEYERIPLSAEELAEEQLAISLTIIDGETTLSRERQPVGATHRRIVEGMGIDKTGRIWLQMGYTGETFFRVYSPEGVLEAVAFPDGSIPDDAQWSITPDGMLAWDGDPDDWPKIYLPEVTGE